MRVISGKYRGKKLESPLGNDVRPTGDKVKESIFNVIQFDVAGSSFLDLFCGSGYGHRGDKQRSGKSMFLRRKQDVYGSYSAKSQRHRRRSQSAVQGF